MSIHTQPHNQPYRPEKKVLPSLIAAPFESLRESILTLEAAGMNCLHYDVMDGHFVPNLTIGPLIIERLSRCVQSRFDVHLMVTNPEVQLDWFHFASVHRLTVHIEAAQNPRALIEKIHGMGKQAGITLNPPTPVEALAPVLALVDHVLVMSVHPGFSGQTFMPETLPKAEHLAEERRKHGYAYRIQMDGGIGPATIISAFEAGVDEFIAGSAVFGAEQPVEAYRQLCTAVGAF